MSKGAKIITVWLVALLALVVVSSVAQAEPPSADQIAEIEGEIELCEAADADLDTAIIDCITAPNLIARTAAVVRIWEAYNRMKEHGQKAVDLANTYYGTGVTGAKYDPSLKSLGATRRDESIRIGTEAFRFGNTVSPGWLASTKIHEGTHRQQIKDGIIDELSEWNQSCTQCNVLYHETEIEAYEKELEEADNTGLTDAEKQELQKRIAGHQWKLSVNSTDGGSVTTPGEGAFTYPRSKIIDLVATPDGGYRFANWTGDVGEITDVNATSTNITMKDNYSITANFEPAPLDHFMCYWVGEDMLLPEWSGVVYLEDQFCAVEAWVESPWGFYNPVEKWHDGVLTPIADPDHHLLAYDIHYEEEPQRWQVEVNNQFGVQSLIVYGPVALAVPTQKIEPMYHEPPVGLDHFMVYEIIEGPPVNVVVSLNDQFGDQPQVEVGYPDHFLNPVQKTDASGMVTEIQNPLGHLVSYEIYGQVYYQQVQAVNQFGEHIFPQTEGPYCLTVPSEKLSANPVTGTDGIDLG